MDQPNDQPVLPNRSERPLTDKPSGSLRTFHIVFVVAAALVCLVFGLWALREFMRAGGAIYILEMVVSLALIILLVLYGRWFWHKIQSQHIA